MIVILLLVVILVIILLGVVFYLPKRHYRQLEQAVQLFDRELKTRWDMIPSFIQLAKKDAKQERKDLETLILLHNKLYRTLTWEEKIHVNQQIDITLGRILTLMIENESLRANESFQELGKKLMEVETAITQKRAIYNEKVSAWNRHVVRFPLFYHGTSYSFYEEER